MLRFESREFDHESYAYHRVDAQVMERLTSSPYVVDAYGYCGQSVVTEYADGTARARIKDPNLHASHRLRMARDLARALEHVHSIDDGTTNRGNSVDGQEQQQQQQQQLQQRRSSLDSWHPTVAHNDVNIANVVESGGTLKLNDFNIAVLMRKKKKKKNKRHDIIEDHDDDHDDDDPASYEPCGSFVRFASPMWKSPEEQMNASYIDPARADVYGLGNLLYQILTTRQPWTHLEPGGPLDKMEVAKRKMGGGLPHIPSRYGRSTKLAVQALHEAVLACFRHEPERRPSSRRLASGLETALKWHRGKRHPTGQEIRELFRA